MRNFSIQFSVYEAQKRNKEMNNVENKMKKRKFEENLTNN